MEPTIDQLRSFCAVVEERSFVHAAQKCHMSQPHVSRVIQDLERRVGVSLLVRSSRGVVTTPAGQVMYEESLRTLQCLADGLARVRRAGSGRSAELIVGFVSSVQPGFLTRLAEGFESSFPSGRLQFREMHSGEQARQLSNGEIDAGILRPPVELVNVRSERLYSEHLVVVGPDSSLSRPLKLETLASEPVVVYERYLGGAPVVAEQALAAAGVRPRVVAEAPSTQVLVDLVNQGVGVAVVPESTVKGLIADDHIYALDPPTFCSVVFCWPVGAESDALIALRDLVLDFAHDPHEIPTAA